MNIDIHAHDPHGALLSLSCPNIKSGQLLDLRCGGNDHPTIFHDSNVMGHDCCDAERLGSLVCLPDSLKKQDAHHRGIQSGNICSYRRISVYIRGYKYISHIGLGAPVCALKTAAMTVIGASFGMDTSNGWYL